MNIESSNATGSSVVGKFTIRYSIQKDKDENPKTVSANIYDGMNVVGTANCTSGGEFGISVTERAEMTIPERSAVVSQIMADFNDIFSDQSNQAAPAEE